VKPGEIKLVVAALLLLAPGMSEEEVSTNSSRDVFRSSISVPSKGGCSVLLNNSSGSINNGPIVDSTLPGWSTGTTWWLVSAKNNTSQSTGHTPPSVSSPKAAGGLSENTRLGRTTDPSPFFSECPRLPICTLSAATVVIQPCVPDESMTTLQKLSEAIGGVSDKPGSELSDVYCGPLDNGCNLTRHVDSQVTLRGPLHSASVSHLNATPVKQSESTLHEDAQCGNIYQAECKPMSLSAATVVEISTDRLSPKAAQNSIENSPVSSRKLLATTRPDLSTFTLIWKLRLYEPTYYYPIAREVELSHTGML